MTLEDPFSSFFFLSPFDILKDPKSTAPKRKWVHCQRYLELTDDHFNTKQKIKYLSRQIGVLDDPDDINEAIATVAPLFKKYWKLSLELQFMENMVYNWRDHVDFKQYRKILKYFVTPNNVKVKDFEDTPDYKFQSFSPVLDLATIEIEHVIAWLFTAMPAVSRVNTYTHERDYLCPYCEVTSHSVRFYDIVKYKRHICYSHGVLNKGTWTSPPIILKVGDEIRRDGTPKKVKMACSMCHVTIEGNNICNYNRHFVKHHVCEDILQEETVND